MRIGQLAASDGPFESLEDLKTEAGASTCLERKISVQIDGSYSYLITKRRTFLNWSPLYLHLPLENLSLLVVDDNSPDGTGELADDVGLRAPGMYQRAPPAGQAGLGTAYIAGFQCALKDGADAIAQMDADFSHPPEKLVELADALQTLRCRLGLALCPRRQRR